MIINHNLNAMNAHRQMGINTTNGAKSMEKLSSGLRVNRAGDDAAGLAISEKMRAQIRGLDQASRNAQDGISLIQTAEGALNETHSILQRMRELAVQSSTDTNVGGDRTAIQDEMNQLTAEIDRIASNTEFNTQKLLDGSYSNKKFQIGSNTNQDMSLNIGKMDTASLGLTSTISLENGTTAAATLKDGTYKVDAAKNVLDATGNIVGKVSGAGAAGNKLYVGTTAVLSGVKDAFEDGTLITISSSGTKFEAKGAINATAAKMAPGDYKVIAGTITKDNTIVGKLSGTNYAIMKQDGTYFAVSAADLKVSTTAVTNNISFRINGSDVSTRDTAAGSIKTINDAIESVSKERSKLGAVQNRLEHTIANLNTSSENLSASESRIRDVDMAKEMMMFSKNNILSQAAQAMLAQANQQPQGVLQLLR